MGEWSRVVAGCGDAQVPGRQFELSWDGERWLGPIKRPRQLPSSGPERVRFFFETASEIAKELAGLMSLGPVSPEITNLIQETLLPQSGPVHVAEVFLSGLLEGTDEKTYRFVPGARELLQKSMLKVDEKLVFQVLSRYISTRYGQTPREFRAFLQRHDDWSEERWNEVEGFAQLNRQAKAWPEDFPPPRILDFTTGTLLEKPKEPDIDGEWPPLETEEFTVPKIAVEPITETPTGEELDVFEFEIAQLVRQDGEWIVEKTPGRGRRYTEMLPGEIALEMVAIPSGTFLMGSPENEPERFADEGPQHEVKVPAFFLGRYPITQAQYEAVMGTNPATKYEEKFVAPDKPVVGVSWDDAVKFCDRLSEITGRAYRLPSEAEWEYACRAGTTTPFHFGETISTDVANYNGNYTYGDGAKGEHRKVTTPVNFFNVANGFGLVDMHGNVREWCQDDWHENYEEAPTDGSAWKIQGTPGIDKNIQKRVIHGGSWLGNPRYCRCAIRIGNARVRYNDVGFRVACGGPRT